MSSDKITSRIRFLFEKFCERAIMGPNEALRAASEIGRVNIKDCVDENGRLKRLRDIPDATARAISTFKTDGRKREIKLFDKDKQITNMLKVHKKLDERAQVNVKIDYAAEMKKGRERSGKPRE